MAVGNALGIITSHVSQRHYIHVCVYVYTYERRFLTTSRKVRSSTSKNTLEIKKRTSRKAKLTSQ